MAIYFLYGFYNSKEASEKGQGTRDFLFKYDEPQHGKQVRQASLSSSDDGPVMSPSSENDEDDEGFQSNLLTSEDESPRHTISKNKHMENGAATNEE